MGGGPGNLSDREVPKKAIAEEVEKRHQRRQQNREPKKEDNCLQLTTNN